MDVHILLPLVRGAGVMALTVVAFALLFTWPSVVPSLRAARSETGRLWASLGLGAALIGAGAVVYLAPSVLLSDDPSPLLMLPISITWVIASAALLVRGMLATGVARVVSSYFSIVSFVGLVAGVLAAAFSGHESAAGIAPTGAFLLALAAVVGVVAWAQAEDPSPVPAPAG